VLEKQPKIGNYEEILQRQIAITDRFLAGKWFKLWGYIPFFPSMERTSDMYDKIVKKWSVQQRGPASAVKDWNGQGKQHNYPLAVKAYELAADRYHESAKNCG